MAVAPDRFPLLPRAASGKLLDRKVTNVRNLTSPFWRSSLKDPARRCLVPVTGFCEWEGEKGAKREHWVSLRLPVFFRSLPSRCMGSTPSCGWVSQAARGEIAGHFCARPRPTRTNSLTRRGHDQAQQVYSTLYVNRRND
ncbi:SOS response-associated peptidase family protein [Sphingosinicella sp. BN140058]|uniref:SOS response-associated peptidase family protein n=1 Tax=Sphingosinicella sp. BN140058 TaxID=1892855 RepID=UPI001FB0890E|nr:SOS response-associated peptidase family protein [Sphingosinicella sp. BN140058]